MIFSMRPMPEPKERRTTVHDNALRTTKNHAAHSRTIRNGRFMASDASERLPVQDGSIRSAQSPKGKPPKERSTVHRTPRARREGERQPQEAMEATSPSCNDDKDAGERLTVRPMPFLSGGKVSRPKGNRTNRSGFGPFRRTRRDVPVRP